MHTIGEKLQELRMARGLSLRELAARADVSASLLSQIENGKANPSVMSLLGIAAALDVPVHTFFPEAGDTDAEDAVDNGAAPTPRPAPTHPPVEITHIPQTASALRSLSEDPLAAAQARHPRPADPSSPVVHAANRAQIELMGGVTWARLTPGREDGVEFLEIVYAPGGSSGPALSRHGGREFGVILEGELVLELAFERYELNAGDSIAFDSSVPHRLTNPGESPMRAIWVNFAPPH